MKLVYLTLLVCGFSICNAQNWNKLDSTLNTNISDTIWRSGPVLVSDYISNPANNKFGVVTKYDSTNNRGLFVSLNEPDFFNIDSDSTRVGLATSSQSNHTTFVASNYANFHVSENNLDVHNSTGELSYFRGTSDLLGFRDGAMMDRAATLRLVGAFGNNERSYSNNEFDILNLRFFTSENDTNYAAINNFYGIRLENLRGKNKQIIQNGWGVYMQPKELNNYFGGKVGIGIDMPTAALSVVSDTINPISISGLKVDTSTSTSDLLSIDGNGIVYSKSLQSLNENFETNTTNVTLGEDSFLYVHTGADVTYTLPSANTRKGKTWKIVNVGSGTITFTQTFLEGSEVRSSLLNQPGFYTIELFSDGTNYIAL